MRTTGPESDNGINTLVSNFKSPFENQVNETSIK